MPESRDQSTAARHDQWALVLIVGLALWAVLPRLIQSLTAQKYANKVGVESPPLTALSSVSSTLLGIAVAGLCVLIVFDVAKDKHPGRFGGLLLVLSPWVYLTIRDLFVGGRPGLDSLMYPIVVATLWLLRPRLAVLRGLGYVAGASAAISIALALVLPSKGLLFAVSGDLVTESKAIITSGILVGFLTHGNNLGQFLALGLPFVGLVPDRRLRWLIVAITGFALLWTAARSILGAVVVGVLAVAVSALMHPVTRRWLAPTMLLVLFVVGAVLPFFVSNPRLFTNRGLIWTTSLGWWQQNPVFGLGSDYYGRVGSTSSRVAGSVFNGHNQTVHLLVTGGIVLAVLVACLLVAAARASGEIAASGRLVAVGYLATLAGSCVLEKSLAIVDNFPMLLMTAVPLTVLLCGDLGRPTEPDLGRRASLGLGTWDEGPTREGERQVEVLAYGREREVGQPEVRQHE